jgi:hypothetical protein
MLTAICRKNASGKRVIIVLPSGKAQFPEGKKILWNAIKICSKFFWKIIRRPAMPINIMTQIAILLKHKAVLIAPCLLKSPRSNAMDAAERAMAAMTA